jgi:hypothetical protein
LKSGKVDAEPDGDYSPQEESDDEKIMAEDEGPPKLEAHKKILPRKLRKKRKF